MNSNDGMPSEFVQLCTLGGWIFDLSVVTASLVRDELDKPEKATPFACVKFEDLYGAECAVRAAHVVAFRHHTPDSAATYKGMHADDGDESWG